METSLVQSIKLSIVSAVGLSKDALHIYVGMSVLLLTAAIFRKPMGSALPLILVLCVAIAGELLDMRDDLASFGYWRWPASVHDILNTIFWPAVLTGVARFTQVFRRIH